MSKIKKLNFVLVVTSVLIVASHIFSWVMGADTNHYDPTIGWTIVLVYVIRDFLRD